MSSAETQPDAAKPAASSESPFLMNDSDALDSGLAFCAERKYRCVLKETELNGSRRWRVVFDASRGEAWGQLQLEFDAVTWALRDVDDRVRGPGCATHYDEESPQTDERERSQPQKRGKRRGKLKRNAKHVQ